MLYVFPLFFLVYGFFFPLGVLLYWLTTNLWSMGQQYVVIHRMEPAAAGGPAVTPSGPAPGAKPKLPPRGPAAKPAPAGPAPDAGPDGSSSKPGSTGDVVLPPGGAISGPIRPSGPAPAKRPANRSNKRKRRGRR
jgi:YidC/Oxa1 family membrane protein insertase